MLQPRLVVGIHADEFDTEFSGFRPSPLGQIHCEPLLPSIEVDLNLKILQSSAGKSIQ